MGGSAAVSGRITGIAADQGNANIIYVAAAGGGVWKTIDGGNTWAPLTDAQQSLSMGAIAVARSNPQVIYAGTGEANNAADSNYGVGILHSSDGGATWALAQGPQQHLWHQRPDDVEDRGRSHQPQHRLRGHGERGLQQGVQQRDRHLQNDRRRRDLVQYHRGLWHRRFLV
jgi:photosystem II stability/assembly factor-like uncharacterized protein